jgi:excisionase family DNA binding protein
MIVDKRVPDVIIVRSTTCEGTMDKKIEQLLSQPTITVDEAAKVLRIGRNAAYERVRAGDVASVSMGRRRLVLTAPLKRQLGIVAAGA